MRQSYSPEVVVILTEGWPWVVVHESKRVTVDIVVRGSVANPVVEVSVHKGLVLSPFDHVLVGRGTGATNSCQYFGTINDPTLCRSMGAVESGLGLQLWNGGEAKRRGVLDSGLL